MNWDDVTNEVLDFAVFEALNRDMPHGWSTERVWNALGEKRPKFTMSWADMGPLISSNKISINYYENQDCGFCSLDTVSFIDFNDGRECRAAAIVFLMMNGVKSEDLSAKKS